MKIKIFTDGASRGNPGPASYGFVIKNDQDNLIYEEGKTIGITTNNVAEYTAVLSALEYVKNYLANGEKVEIELRADSKLVVEQLSGKYKIKAEHLRILISQIRELSMQLGKIHYKHIPRELNTSADFMANQALDA